MDGMLQRPGFLWLLAALPVFALLASRTLRAVRRRRSVFAGPRLRGGAGADAGGAGLNLLGLAAICAALADPHHVRSRQERGPEPLLIAVLDLSPSMRAIDGAPSRLAQACADLRELLRALPGQRAALIACSGEPVLLSPATRAHETLEAWLDHLPDARLQIDGPGLASGIALARELAGREAVSARLLVFSDGDDPSLEPGPAPARNVPIDAALYGTRAGAPLALAEGGRLLLLEDAGRPVVSRARPDNLARLALSSGGILWNREGEGLPVERLAAALGGGAGDGSAASHGLAPLLAAVALLSFSIEGAIRGRRPVG